MAVVVFGAGVTLAVIALFFLQLMRGDFRRPLADKRTIRAGNHMARLLDAAVADPITPTTDQWRNEARKAASRWFDRQGE